MPSPLKAMDSIKKTERVSSSQGEEQASNVTTIAGEAISYATVSLLPARCASRGSMEPRASEHNCMRLHSSDTTTNKRQWKLTPAHPLPPSLPHVQLSRCSLPDSTAHLLDF